MIESASKHRLDRFSFFALPTHWSCKWIVQCALNMHLHLTHGLLGPQDCACKRHLDQFSCFWTAHPWPPCTDTWIVFTRRHQCAPTTNTCYLGTHKSLLQSPSRLVQWGWEVSVCHLAKFREDRSNRCQDMAIFRFQDGGRPPPCIFTNSKFWPSLGLRESNCVVMANRRITAELSRFNGF